MICTNQLYLRSHHLAANVNTSVIKCNLIYKDDEVRSVNVSTSVNVCTLETRKESTGVYISTYTAGRSPTPSVTGNSRKLYPSSTYFVLDELINFY